MQNKNEGACSCTLNALAISFLAVIAVIVYVILTS
jgi:hypothetical protein